MTTKLAPGSLRQFILFATAAAALGPLAACTGQWQLQQATAAALYAIANQTQSALDECNHDLQLADDFRQQQIINAYNQRLCTDHGDDQAIAAHTADFTAALNRITADRRTQWTRHCNASGNIDLIREFADAFQRNAAVHQSNETAFLTAAHYLPGLDRIYHKTN